MFDSEIKMAVAFIQEVEGHKIRSDIEDQWVWAAESSGSYLARSAYRVIREGIPEEEQDREFKELWKLKVPMKVTMFAWRLLKDRLPTRDNWRRKRVELHEYVSFMHING